MTKNSNLGHRRDIVNTGHSQDVQDDVGNADKEHRSTEEYQSGWTVIDPAQSRFA